MARDTLKLAVDFEFTVIDGPPHAAEIARSCIIAADFVALPIEPSGLSTWAADLTVKQVQEAQEYKDTLKCGFVVSRKIGNTVIGRQIREMAAEGGIPILTAEVENCVPFAESLTMGQSIFEWAPKSPAAHEIKSLTKENFAMFDGRHPNPKMEDATMADREHSKDSSGPDVKISSSEVEIIQLLQKAAQDYEECMTLADFPDYQEVPEVNHPQYSWNNPIGLVVTERSHGNLV